MTPLQRRARKALLAIDGVVEGDNVFYNDRTAFWVNGKQVAHWRDDASFELRLTRRVISEHRARLKADPCIELRRGASDWLIVRCERTADLGLLGELAQLAVAAHMPPDGEALRPPPGGADLERRRRFH